MARSGGDPITRLRVALAQIEPVLGDVRANVSRHLEWIGKALREGADLVVFPELSLTGYLLQDLTAEVAVRLDAPRAIRPLLEASRRIGLVVGLVEESAGHRFYNSALYLEGGRVRHLHRKVHLPTYGLFDEGRFFAEGDRLQAFAARFGRAGLLVCEDFWHASSALVLAQDGADYLLVVSAAPTEGIDRRRGLVGHAAWIDLARVTARLQTQFVIVANRVGFEDGVNFSGGSCVCDPTGRVLAEGPLLREDLVVCDLERRALRRARVASPLLRDARLPVLAREVGRLLAVPATGRARRPA